MSDNSDAIAHLVAMQDVIFLAFDRQNNYPLPNLYTSMLQRLDLEVETFASATETMQGLEMS